MKNWLLFVVAMLIANGVFAAESDSDDMTLLTSRTTSPELSPEVVRALELDVPEWHKKGATGPSVKIGDEVGRQSAEAALQALNALDPAVPQSDFDRAWIVYEKGSALKTLGRNDEARSVLESLRGMPRTNWQDRKVLMALHDLGDERHPGSCPSEGRLVISKLDTRPVYPHAALACGIEGWVNAMIDIQPDGSISFVSTQSSSLRVFEQPVIFWLKKQQWQLPSGAGPGRPCFAVAPVHFGVQPPGKARFPIDGIAPDIEFTYRSIGAAIRVRAVAREAALAKP